MIATLFALAEAIALTLLTLSHKLVKKGVGRSRLDSVEWAVDAITFLVKDMV
jgi:hypothetical protein